MIGYTHSTPRYRNENDAKNADQHMLGGTLATAPKQVAVDRIFGFGYLLLVPFQIDVDQG